MLHGYFSRQFCPFSVHCLSTTRVSRVDNPRKCAINTINFLFQPDQCVALRIDNKGATGID